MSLERRVAFCGGMHEELAERSPAAWSYRLLQFGNEVFDELAERTGDPQALQGGAALRYVTPISDPQRWEQVHRRVASQLCHEEAAEGREQDRRVLTGTAGSSMLPPGSYPYRSRNPRSNSAISVSIRLLNSW